MKIESWRVGVTRVKSMLLYIYRSIWLGLFEKNVKGSECKCVCFV